MASFQINKGIGRTVEFKGLKAQYLFIFAGGLLGLFITIVILYMIGINQYVCLILGLISAGILIWKTFELNTKYGEHGLMKISARKRHPKFISRHYTILSLINFQNQSI
ncbi:DUF4133 domain-containing protein [Tenacibaculum jejuense]|uniref:Conjugative transposon protein TraF n=1 Tax=Tenacibaculum jejuense TaxID=584609 RepID=A0A238U5W5_9FLAO|nr:DUF4133 domain-containing protein [Tenacibaculum jejuense]SNR14435.1 Conjugative transposon protein TraF [Tenacibaculum jejuense]